MTATTRRAAAALRRTDNGRIHDDFRSLLSTYDVARSGDIPPPIEWLSPQEIYRKGTVQQQVSPQFLLFNVFLLFLILLCWTCLYQEDFFERAMREQEAEVQGINQTMHHVNEIYKVGDGVERPVYFFNFFFFKFISYATCAYWSVCVKGTRPDC